MISKTNKKDCLENGGVWFGNGQGCTDATFNNQADCLANGKSWQESWRYCSDGAYYDSRNECLSASKQWQYTKESICLVVFYKDGNGSVIGKSSDPFVLIENGTSQSILFDGPNFSIDIPIGLTAVTMYEYTDNDKDGTYCEPSDEMLYPEDRKTPLHIIVRPSANLPIINW